MRPLSPARGYNAVYCLWEGFAFPNNLSPAPNQPELSFDAFFANLQAAGVTRLRVKFCGWNGPLGTSALSFEPALGVFNDWGGRLDAAVDAALSHGITFHVIPFDNEEWRTGWGVHAWNVDNGGFLAAPNALFTDPRAIEAAHARIDAIVDRCWSVVGAWELCAEMSNIMIPAFLGGTWESLEGTISTDVVPWVEDLVQYIQARSAAPVGNGQLFAPQGFDAPGAVRNLVYRTPSLDFALTNAYGAGSVAEKVKWLRDCQAYTGKPVYIEQYAPWEIGRDAPYTREPDDLSWSKAHEWAFACGEYGAIGPLRWIEIKPAGDYPTWWGVVHPNLAEIAGVTRALSDALDRDAWRGRGSAWDERIASDYLNLCSSWSDGQRVTAFLGWSADEPHLVEIAGLPDGPYEAHCYDWIAGDEIEVSYVVSVDGSLTFYAPHRSGCAALYVTPPAEPPTPPETTMHLLLQELQDGEVIRQWAVQLEELA